MNIKREYSVGEIVLYYSRQYKLMKQHKDGYWHAYLINDNVNGVVVIISEDFFERIQ